MKDETIEEAPSEQEELMADLAEIAQESSPTDTMVLSTVGGPMAWGSASWRFSHNLQDMCLVGASSR